MCVARGTRHVWTKTRDIGFKSISMNTCRNSSVIVLSAPIGATRDLHRVGDTSVFRHRYHYRRPRGRGKRHSQ